MRSARFETFLREQLSASGTAVSARSDSEADRVFARGDYGVRVTPHGGGVVEMLLTAQSAPGDHCAEPEAVVEGDAARAPIAAAGPIDGEKVRVADVEAAVALLIVASGNREVAEIVRRFSEQDPPGAVSHGMLVRFRSGARIYLDFLTAHPAGQRAGTAWRCPDVI